MLQNRLNINHTFGSFRLSLGSTVVEHLTPNPKIKGTNPATSTGGLFYKTFYSHNGAPSPTDVTNLKYKLLFFLTPNKKKFKEKGTSF
jgi:hypothetical protein